MYGLLVKRKSYPRSGVDGRMIFESGTIFTNWTVIEEAPMRGKRKYWKCKCKCGTVKEVLQDTLVNGSSKSCGCLNNKKNNYDLSNEEYGIGYDNNHNKFLFDIEDYDLIKNYHWYKNAQGYFCSYDKGKTIRMHRLIMNCPDNLEVDHIHHNKFDNRKSELRICTQSMNIRNKKAKLGNLVFRGLVNDKNQYYARIILDKKMYTSKKYETIHEAACEYDRLAIKYHGEYAYLNFPREWYEQGMSNEEIIYKWQHPEEKLTIIVDVDNTVNDLCSAVLSVYNERYNDNLRPEDITDYYIENFVKDEAKEDFWKLFTEKETWKRIKPINVEAVRWLLENHNTYFCTACMPENLYKKSRWLSRIFPGIDIEDKLILCQHKQMILGDYLIDDCVANFAGGQYESVCLKYPWNSKFRGRRWDSISEWVKFRFGVDV